ncbi:MAG: 2-amino-4-hydroxy-6-hydroxymethyldihydropteridine diphosphokinase [Proteobacteria bacterium]|nr:2-amino-4-hydroxy-6-hydroxymethyldihydropteridine diphosphokinase [Pseudomonadota bacterium]
MVNACIGLGGNLGDVPVAIAGALAALNLLPDTRVLRCSRLYRTPAWGHTAQPDFINTAAVLETRLPPRTLLTELLAIERAHGRDRSGDAQRWGPRTLDLDLLLYGDATIASADLHIPHPHLHERAFVLVPLAEIAPDASVPGRGRVRDLLAAIDAGAIVALD